MFAYLPASIPSLLLFEWLCIAVNANHCASVWQRGWDWGWGWGWDMRRPVTKEPQQEEEQRRR